jgi:hypothetical protein
MSTRDAVGSSESFWDMIEGRRPFSPSSELLGFVPMAKVPKCQTPLFSPTDQKAISRADVPSGPQIIVRSPYPRPGKL